MCLSIQPAGDQIRVTAQLIDARTGGHVWSNRYDRPATDLFRVQGDVTEKVAATLSGYEGALAQAERSIVRRKPPSRMEAKHKVTKEGLEEAERLFRKALELDPQLARAYVGLVYIYEYRIDLGLGTSAADNLTMQMEAARNAVRLDPNDGETQLVLGHAFAYQGKGEQALEQFAKAEALAPKRLRDAHSRMGVLIIIVNVPMTADRSDLRRGQAHLIAHDGQRLALF